MSQSNYFLNFPSFNYAGYAATNIMARAVIASKFKDNFNLFYDYKVPEGKRADQIAFDLYGKPELVWVIYLFNDIHDPYYDWPLSNENFNNMILQKYGTFANASQQILGYRNNWPSDDRQIDRATYSAMSANQKKYWQPVIAPGNIITGYVRQQKDTMVTTNEIVQWTVAGYGNTSLNFATGEQIKQGNSTGVVACSNQQTNTLIIQHVNGGFNDSTLIVGQSSGATATPQAQSLILTPVIPNDELVYFNAMSAMDQETESNEEKALIKLLRVEYVQMVQDALAEAMTS